MRSPKPIIRFQKRRPFAAGAAAGAAFGLLMLLAFPPVGLWPVVFLAPLPLVLLVEVAGRLRTGTLRVALGAWLGSVPWWGWAMIWTARNTQAGYLPLLLVLGANVALFAWAYARTRRRFPGVPTVALLPILWVGIEVFRGEFSFDGYPWFLVAHPLIDGPSWLLTWPAAVVGVYGVCALTVLPVAAIWDGVCGRRRSAIVATVLVAAWPVFGVLGVLSPEAVGATRVAIVQTNVPQSVRGQWDPAQRWADWLRMRELTLTAAVGGPDVIVWPETMFPGTAFDLPSVRAEQAAQLVWRLPGPDGRDVQIPAWAIRSELMTVQRELGVPMIVGAASFEQMRIVEDDKGLRYDWASRQNSAFLVSGGRVNEGWYSKLKLAPFGEVMPYISAWPWLEERLLDFGARGMRFDLEPGAGPLTLDIPTDGEPVRAATPICFEIAAAGVVRTLVFDGARRRADVLLTLTNDGWFGDWDGGREQHLQVARWRSVELGTGMARAANTGVSAIVDGRGRVLASGVDAKPGASRVDGVLTGDVPIYAGATPFATRVGLWPAWGLAVIAAAACVVPMKRRR